MRSGVLTSVHVFATDPRRGISILAILVAFIGGALALYAWREPLLKQGGLFAPISREGALVLNNLFLTCACATVFVGTRSPARARSADRREDFRRAAILQPRRLVRCSCRCCWLMPLGRCSDGRRGDLLVLRSASTAAAFIAAVAIAAAFASQHGGPVLVLFGVGLAIFVMVARSSTLPSALSFFAYRSERRPRAAGLPRSAWGTAFSRISASASRSWASSSSPPGI